MKRQELENNKVKLIQYTPEENQSGELSSLIEWVADHRKSLKTELLQNGALRFRGFSVADHKDFDKILQAFGVNKKKYVGGNNPRHDLGNQVYLSTLYPPSWSITLHSEMSQLNDWPTFIGFYCQRAPDAGKGGATPICPSQTILNNISSDLMEKLEDKQILYVQTMRSPSKKVGFGQTWDQVFQTSDKEKINAFCKDNDISIQWLDDDSLVAKFLRPPTIHHPVDQTNLWFNQAEQWHPSNLEDKTRMIIEKKMGKKGFPHFSMFGDEEEFDEKDLQHIRSVYRESAGIFPWESGDVLLLDNLKMMHGREPFSGDREVYVAMGGCYNELTT